MRFERSRLYTVLRCYSTYIYFFFVFACVHSFTPSTIIIKLSKHWIQIEKNKNSIRYDNASWKFDNDRLISNWLLHKIPFNLHLYYYIEKKYNFLLYTRIYALCKFCTRLGKSKIILPWFNMLMKSVGITYLSTKSKLVITIAIIIDNISCKLNAYWYLYQLSR